jgi:hypothetical protein
MPTAIPRIGRATSLAVSSLAALAACRDTPVARQNHSAPELPLIDAKLATMCVVTYSCGLSHPGLGTSLDAVSVDLAKCTRTKRSESGPYESEVPVSPQAKAPSPPPPVPIPPAQCRRVAALVSAITPSEARDAKESAHIDSTACGLDVVCPPDTAPKLRIQRQTTSGKSRVEELIRSL